MLLRRFGLIKFHSLGIQSKYTIYWMKYKVDRYTRTKWILLYSTTWMHGCVRATFIDYTHTVNRIPIFNRWAKSQDTHTNRTAFFFSLLLQTLPCLKSATRFHHFTGGTCLVNYYLKWISTCCIFLHLSCYTTTKKSESFGTS